MMPKTRMSSRKLIDLRKESLTEPVVQLMDPSLASVFDRRIKEDNLILYPYLVDNRFKSHLALEEL